MVDATSKNAPPSDTPKAILVGSLLGLFFSGIIIAGVCGWQLWAASAAEEAAAGAVPDTVPPPGYSGPGPGVYGDTPSASYGSGAYTTVSPYGSVDDTSAEPAADTDEATTTEP